MLASIFCLIIGIASLYAYYSLNALNKKIKNWRKTKALVVSKEVKDARMAHNRQNFRIEVIYDYVITGKSYRNNIYEAIELIKGEQGYYKKDAEKFLSKLSDQIEIFYNPENPGESYVSNKTKVYRIITLVAGLLLVIGSFLSFMI